MAKGFEINPRGIRELQDALTRELAKRPIPVPITADPAGLTLPQGLVVNYNGPVVTVNGDHAQLAWNNDDVHQTQAVEQIAPGYENLAQAVTQVLALLDGLGLDPDDAQDARDHAKEVLSEVTKADPDRNLVRRGVTVLKGVLAAAGAGVNAAVTAESAEAARHLIEMLGNSLPG